MKIKEGTGNFASPDGPFDIIAYMIDSDEYKEDYLKDNPDEDEGSIDYIVEDNIQEDYDWARKSAQAKIDNLSSKAKAFYSVSVDAGYYDGLYINIASERDADGSIREHLEYGGNFIFVDTLESLESDEIMDTTELPKEQQAFIDDYMAGGYSKEELTDLTEDFEKRFGKSMVDVITENCSKHQHDAEEEIEAMLTDLVKDGWQRLGVSARFNSGETWYSKKENTKNRRLRMRESVKPINTAMYKAVYHMNMRERMATISSVEPLVKKYLPNYKKYFSVDVSLHDECVFIDFKSKPSLDKLSSDDQEDVNMDFWNMTECLEDKGWDFYDSEEWADESYESNSVEPNYEFYSGPKSKHDYKLFYKSDDDEAIEEMRDDIDSYLFSMKDGRVNDLFEYKTELIQSESRGAEVMLYIDRKPVSGSDKKEQDSLAFEIEVYLEKLKAQGWYE